MVVRAELGGHYLRRIGNEVLIDVLDGDTDQPADYCLDYEPSLVPFNSFRDRGKLLCEMVAVLFANAYRPCINNAKHHTSIPP